MTKEKIIEILSEKQKEVLKLMDKGYAMIEKNGKLVMLTESSREIPLDWSVDIRPLHEMGLIKDHSTMLEYVYLNLSEKGKETIKD